MTGKMENELGKVVIDNEVIATYAGSVAVECFGIVGMAAAAACCMLGGTGGGLPLAAGHEDNGSAGCAEQRTGRAVCVGVESRQPAIFAGVYGGLRGGGYRGRDRPEEHPPRRGAWLGGVG